VHKETVEPIIIASIMAEAETATEVAPETTSPSLSEAYTAGENRGIEEKPRWKEERGRNTSLASEDDTARSLASSLESARAPKKDQTLSQAFSGEQPEDADVLIEQDGLPEALQQFGLDDVAAVMARFGLTSEDLADPRWQNAIADVLQSQGETGADEEAKDEDDPEKAQEKEEEKKADEQKPEEKKAEPRPSKLADLTPEQHAEMGKHIEQVWARAQQVNDPIYTEKFVSSLAGILGTPPEQLETLQHTVEALQWGAMNLMESAVPALVHAYLQQNFSGVIESYAPGFSADYTERQMSTTWDGVRGDLPEFSLEPGSEFQKLAQKLPPELAAWEPRAADGKPLPFRVALKVKADVVAKAMRGERATPAAMMEVVMAATENGRRGAQKSNRRIGITRPWQRAHHGHYEST
jgi:hypothetical protein